MATTIPRYTLKVHAILLSNDDGTKASNIDAGFLQDLFVKVNMRFEPVHIEFEFDPATDVEVRADTALNSESNGGANWWVAGKAAAAKIPGKVVLLFRHGPGATPSGNGHNYPSPYGTTSSHSKDVSYVALPNTKTLADQGDGDFVAHELGHYLGLKHTFPGGGNASVYGANWKTLTADQAKTILVRYIRTNGGTESALDGDGIGDTPPDPGKAIYKALGIDPCARPSFTMTGTVDNDEYSYTFVPPTNNMMSYHGCNRPKTFTAEQIAKMRSTLLTPDKALLTNRPCWPNFHRLPMENFQTCFDYWVHRGRWPVTLSASQIGSSTYMSGSFQQGSNRPVRHLIGGTAYQTAFRTFRQQGFRPARVSALTVGSTPRYTAIWTPVDGRFQARHGMSVSAFDTMWHDLRQKGFLNTDVYFFQTASGTRVNAVWVKKPFQNYATYYGMNAASFESRRADPQTQRFRITTFCAYQTTKEYRYAAIWEKVPGTWSLQYGLTSSQYQQQYNNHAAAGYRIHQIQAYGTRFAAIWTKD